MGTVIILLFIGGLGYGLYKVAQSQQGRKIRSGRTAATTQTTPSRRLFGSPEQVEQEEDEERLRKATLKGNRIIDQWTFLMEGAQGEGEKITREVERKLRAVAVPDLKLEYKEVSLGLFSRLLKGTRKFLIVENKYLLGYHAFVGVEDYGKQLSISWYLTLEQGFLGRMMTLAAKSPIFAFFLFPVTLAVRIFTGGRGYVIPETMDLFDLEELRNYATTVHGAVKDATQALLKDLNINFAQVNWHTRGFFNL